MEYIYNKITKEEFDKIVKEVLSKPIDPTAYILSDKMIDQIYESLKDEFDKEAQEIRGKRTKNEIELLNDYEFAVWQNDMRKLAKRFDKE